MSKISSRYDKFLPIFNADADAAAGRSKDDHRYRMLFDSLQTLADQQIKSRGRSNYNDLLGFENAMDDTHAVKMSAANTSILQNIYSSDTNYKAANDNARVHYALLTANVSRGDPGEAAKLSAVVTDGVGAPAANPENRISDAVEAGGRVPAAGIELADASKTVIIYKSIIDVYKKNMTIFEAVKTVVKNYLNGGAAVAGVDLNAVKDIVHDAAANRRVYLEAIAAARAKSVPADQTFNAVIRAFVYDIAYEHRDAITAGTAAVAAAQANPVEVNAEWNNFFGVLNKLNGQPISNNGKKIIRELDPNDLYDNFMLLLVRALVDDGNNISALIVARNKQAAGLRLGDAAAVNFNANLSDLITAIRATSQPEITTEILNRFKFNINMDKYVRQRLSESKNEAIPTDSGVSNFFKDDNETTTANQNKYWRMADGSLWTTDEDGKNVRVDINSDKFKELTIANKCQGTGIGDGDDDKCADYLLECLAGKSIDKCKSFMKNSSYWQNAADEVEKMLPPVALSTLEAFEFNTVSVFDETNKRNINKIENIESWLLRLKTRLNNEEDFLAISKNEKLVGYLKAVINKVNSSPAILNKGVVRSDEQQANDPSAFKGSRLSKMGLSARLAVPSWAPSSAERLSSAVRSEQGNVRIRLVGMRPGGLFGGANYIEASEERLADKSKQLWYVFHTQYNGLKSVLKDLNKTITDEDNKRIEEHIEKLRKSETKLTQVMLMGEKYRQLLTRYGEQDGHSSLSVDHLKEFTEQRKKYFERVAKKQNDLVSVIKALAEAVNNETKEKTKDESSNSVSSGSPLKARDLLG
jgi:hypothetical protein